MAHPFLGLGFNSWSQKFEREEKSDIIYRITNSGSTFDLRASAFSSNGSYTVYWGDGDFESSTSNNLTHTYSAAGNYKIRVILSDGSTYKPYFASFDEGQLTSARIKLRSSELGLSFSEAFEGASNLARYRQRFNATKNVINFEGAWKGTTSLTNFPRINVSSGTIFDDTWRNSGIVNFPVLDMSSGTSFSGTWRSCDNLVSFPGAIMTSGRDFENAWRSCDNLIDFPANQFDTTGTLSSNAFEDAWKDCALSAQSIENILVSLDTNGASNITLGIQEGTNAAKTTWSTAANTAYTNLINKNWTISYNS